MIKVKLLQPPSIKPIEMASHAAKACYNPEFPELGTTMDVEKALFQTGHHTTLEHTYYTFAVEGIAVGDITLGFHLASPFYNSDQRSGRYSKMFDNPDTTEIRRYIVTYYPEVSEAQLEQINRYVSLGFELYQKYLAEATAHAAPLIHEERPHFPVENLTTQAHKIAQEQMRVLIPVIVPTAYDFTVNLTTLVALYKSAFTPVMRAVTQQMADLAIQDDPRIAVMFERPEPRNWYPDMSAGPLSIKTSPWCSLGSIKGLLNYRRADEELCHPVDQLHFRPELMNNGLGTISTKLTLSLMTMGQNQRHRTIHRGAPSFSGNMYLPPLLAKCAGLQEDYVAFSSLWKQLAFVLPGNLAATLAPYGAMVTYETLGDFNAVCHEQAKRLCWNAQKEIYDLSRQLREQIRHADRNSPLLGMFEPPCYRLGKCLEGKRCCGRQISVRKTGEYFPKRAI